MTTYFENAYQAFNLLVNPDADTKLSETNGFGSMISQLDRATDAQKEVAVQLLQQRCGVLAPKLIQEINGNLKSKLPFPVNETLIAAAETDCLAYKNLCTVLENWVWAVAGVSLNDRGGMIINYEQLAKAVLHYFDVVFHCTKAIDGKNYRRLMVYNYAKGFWSADTTLLQRALFYVLTSVGAWDNKCWSRISKLLTNAAKDVDESKFDQGYIAFGTRDWQASGNELVPHEPSHYCTFARPFTPSDTPTPAFDKFLKTTFNNDVERHHFLETLAYTLEPAYPVAHFSIWTSTGSSGKSIASSILTDLWGSENVSSVPLTKLSEDFGCSGLLRVNVVTEGSDMPWDSSVLKAITSSDPVLVNAKFQQPVTKVLSTKLIFSFNTLPPITDSSLGLARRLDIQLFPNHFLGLDQDVHLQEKLQSEIPGITYRLMQELYLLRDRHFQWSTNEAMDKFKAKYLYSSDPVRLFMSECLKPDPNGKVERSQVYPAFTEWLQAGQKNAAGIHSNIAFWRRAKQLWTSVYGTNFEKMTSSTHGVRNITGVKIAVNYDDDEDEPALPEPNESSIVSLEPVGSPFDDIQNFSSHDFGTPDDDTTSASNTGEKPISSATASKTTDKENALSQTAKIADDETDVALTTKNTKDGDVNDAAKS